MKYKILCIALLLFCCLKSTIVDAQPGPETYRVTFSIFTKDSSNIGDLILKGQRFSFFKKRKFISSNHDKKFKSKYHDYDITLIANSSIIFKNNAVVNQSKSGISVYFNKHEFTFYREEHDRFDSLTIQAHHNGDTMTIKLLHLNRRSNIDLDEIYFMPGVYILDIDKVAAQDYGGEVISSFEGYFYEFVPDENKKPPYRTFNIAPFEWIEKREEAKNNEETGED